MSRVHLPAMSMCPSGIPVEQGSNDMWGIVTAGTMTVSDRRV
jgi:hypothetical protein